jgi:hypothetical protein
VHAEDLLEQRGPIKAATTFIAPTLGAGVSQAYNGTMYPLVGGFAVMGRMALIVALLTDPPWRAK